MRKLFYLALKNIVRKPSRNIMLALSIAILVSLLIFSLSSGMSINAALEKVSGRLGADLIVVPKGAQTSAEEFLLESRVKTFYMDKSVIDKIKSFKGVVRTTYQTYLTTIPGKCCGVIEAQIVAFDPKTDFVVSPWLKKAIGRDLERGEVIVGEGFYEDTGILNIEAVLYEKKFKVVGVLERTDTGMDHAIFMRDEDAREIIKEKLVAEPNQISVVFVELERGYDAELVGREIEGKMLEMSAVPRSKIGEGIRNILLNLNKIFSIIVLMLAVFSIFFAWLIFSVAVNERRREAGIIRAIGATKLHLSQIFLLEAASIGAIGSAAGILGGNLLLRFLSDKFTLLVGLSAGLEMLSILGISILGLITGISICVMGALLPVVKISRLEPLIAIKEE